MADVTRIQDVIIPEVFQNYVIERTKELSAIMASGIMASVPGVTVPRGGVTVNMPFWNDLDSEKEEEVWSSGHETIPDPITASKDAAAILTRIKSWGAEDLAGMFAGSDPMAAIGNLAATYWTRRQQRILLAVLNGIFTTALAGNKLDRSTVHLDNSLMIDAIAVLGDASQDLTGIVMHSAVQFDLARKKLLDPKPTEPGTSTAPEFSSYLGRRIIIDDGAPVTDGVYTTYLFGSGAIGYAEGAPTVPVEIERQGTKSQDVLINRREFIMHARGVKWIGNAANDTPSNTELATATNWQRVFPLKNIPIVALDHMIG